MARSALSLLHRVPSVESFYFERGCLVWGVLSELNICFRVPARIQIRAVRMLPGKHLQNCSLTVLFVRENPKTTMAMSRMLNQNKMEGSTILWESCGRHLRGLRTLNSYKTIMKVKIYSVNNTK
jgi:hypothetical protein